VAGWAGSAAAGSEEAGSAAEDWEAAGSAEAGSAAETAEVEEEEAG
jgi:hypothetical protein